jgi:hypothetical protein
VVVEGAGAVVVSGFAAGASFLLASAGAGADSSAVFFELLGDE